MAFSKMDIPPSAQHFLECDIEECEGNCEFYCNTCYQRLCKQCRDEHLKSSENKNHEVVIYQQRHEKYHVEKCKIHPTNDANMFCEDCSVPVCFECIILGGDHWLHIFADLLDLRRKQFVDSLEQQIYKIHAYYLPISQDLQGEIKKDFSEVKTVMDNIRTFMKAEGESLKTLVDTVVSENMRQVDQIENSLFEDLHTQGKTIDDYITYLNNLLKELNTCVSSTEPHILMPERKPKIRSIPETTKLVIPGFTAGHYIKSDVLKSLGKVNFPNTKAEKREIKSVESFFNAAKKPSIKQMKEDRTVSSKNKITCLSASVTKIREFNVPDVNGLYHMSLDQLGKLWSSDRDGNIIQTDLLGKQIQKIKVTGGQMGNHTITQLGDLIFTDKVGKAINRLTQDNNITHFINTVIWKPYSIYSSHINEDILVGVGKDGEAKVTRFNKAGKEIHNIQRDNKGEELYKFPQYITENINGDICTSDYHMGVVVVNKTRQHRFSYTGQKSVFCPYGICTDVFGHILVCDRISDTIYLLDQNGQFLSLLLTQRQGVYGPRSLCVDDENNLYVGEYMINTLTVYKYLQ